jgi:hypothetical protein
LGELAGVIGASAMVVDQLFARDFILTAASGLGAASVSTTASGAMSENDSARVGESAL